MLVSPGVGNRCTSEPSRPSRSAATAATRRCVIPCGWDAARSAGNRRSRGSLGARCPACGKRARAAGYWV